MPLLIDQAQTAMDTFEPYLHEASDCVRFQVPVSGGVRSASVNRQALKNSFKSADPLADLLSIYYVHEPAIHQTVLRRLAQGALEPVMLRESNFPPL